MVVVDKHGLEGVTIDTSNNATPGNTPSAHDQSVLVRFQNGQQILVPWSLLVHQADGRYLLPISIDEWLATQNIQAGTANTRADMSRADQDDYLVIPVIAEQVSVQKRVVETGVTEIRKTVHERVERVDEPLRVEDVEIERVTVNRIVDAPEQIRQEGDTMIIPLLEEVLVVEKRLMLREEVHIKRIHREVHDPQDVLLHEEQVEIVRKPSNGQGNEQTATLQ